MLSWNHGQEELDKWLTTVGPPFAILAAHDPRAFMVVRGCERAGLRGPNDVAVLGVNDDTSTCETSHPPLSSLLRVIPAGIQQKGFDLKKIGQCFVSFTFSR